ncbi:hypothetical protein [Neolewinella antarctica]|uniref:Uncharacterized protein n=1 Tax=Neolewinella antarctica TaxID=442734 RepID=A0ABX0X6L3_9BACT|nr:hypothetical protein [Neolewinella antarctica]NJC24772.1 hypothetical protein [Neolewinella antarctica]
MYPLNEAYQQHLEAIAVAIQASPNLATYLEEEEDAYYEALKAEFEPQIEQAHQQLIDYSPLEIEAFEKTLLDERFEGLFLPRILGYSVLRGEITDLFYYARQNDHYGAILESIAQNSNFDQIKSRIGQSVQVGFALSSDIFVTNLVDGISSKRVRQFLQAQRASDARTLDGRRRIFLRYARQFKGRNYHYAAFPLEGPELTTYIKATNDFLQFRVSGELDNAAIAPTLHAMITEDDFKGRKEILRPIVFYGTFFEQTPDDRGELMTVLNRERNANPAQTSSEILSTILELKKERDFPFGKEQELNLGSVISRNIDDELTAYFNLTDKIHNDGYVNPDVQAAIAEELAKHSGLSTFAANVRESILQYFKQLAEGFGTEEASYQQWFEVTGKQFPSYIKIFGSESFNQDLRALAKRYTKRLTKVYTNKRGKDYRDIKKITMTTWQDYGFMSEKELKEFFKTPRKKKVEA